MLESSVFPCTEGEIVEFSLDLKLLGNEIEVVFLCLACITYFTGYLTAAEQFIASFHCFKLLLFCFDFRVIRAFVSG